MRGGRLRSPIRIQGRASIRMPDGSLSVDWIDKYSCFAEIQQTVGAETISGEQIVSNAVYRVATRWVAGIGPSDRIIYNRNDGTPEKILEIISVFNSEERNTVMELVCKEAQ